MDSEPGDAPLPPRKVSPHRSDFTPHAMRYRALLLGLLLTAASVSADQSSARETTRPAAHGCALGPVHDRQVVQRRLEEWAGSTHLGRLETWDLGIDRDKTRVRLQLAQGSVTLTWSLDAQCMATAVAIEVSPDFQGSPPDAAAVGRLAESLRPATADPRVAPRWAASHLLLVTCFALLVLGTLGILLREARVQPPPWPAALTLLLVWGIALALRLLLSPRTFLHEGYHIAETVSGYLTGEMPPIYGNTGPALFRLAAALLQRPGDVDVIFVTNAVIASMAIPALALLDLALFGHWPRALCAAVLLSVLPLHLRYSAAEDLFVQATTLGIWTLALFALYLRTRRLGDVLCAALALVLAMQTRPEMLFFPLVLVALVVLAQPRSWRVLFAWRTLLALSAVALMLIPRLRELRHVVHEAPSRVQMLPAASDYFGHLILFQSHVVPPVYWVFMVAGLAWGARRAPRLHLWLFVVFLGCTFFTLSIGTNVPFTLRTQMLPTSLAVLVAAGAASAWTESVRAFVIRLRKEHLPLTSTALAFGALGLALLGTTVVVKWRAWITELGDQQLEWAFLARTVPQLPARGTLLSAMEAGGSNLDAFPQFLLGRSGRTYDLIDVRSAARGEVPWPEAGEELLFYQGIFCYLAEPDDSSSDPMTHPCRAVHARYNLEPRWVEEVEGTSWQRYAGNSRGPFRIGFFWLRALR